jgi:hypothetical protein
VNQQPVGAQWRFAVTVTGVFGINWGIIHTALLPLGWYAPEIDMVVGLHPPQDVQQARPPSMMIKNKPMTAANTSTLLAILSIFSSSFYPAKPVFIEQRLIS